MRKKIVTLALQGGGSHGAFTWGVLDRLLEDPRIEIDGEAYWDGGFTANPPILPLLHLCKARDIVLVRSPGAQAARLAHACHRQPGVHEPAQ